MFFDRPIPYKLIKANFSGFPRMIKIKQKFPDEHITDIDGAVLCNAITGEIDTVQLSLAHNGEFGFTLTLSAPLGRDNAGYWANLYWFNEETEELEFQQAVRISDNGTAEFDLDHASDYTIVIDDRSHEPAELPFLDVPDGAWRAAPR